MWQKFWIVLISVWMMATTANAGQLTANIEPRQVNFGDTVRYDVVYEGDDAGAMQPDFSALQRDFQIFSTSSSMQSSYVNGVGHQKRVWTLLLMPKYEGKLHIPALKLGVYQTTPLELEVLPAGAPITSSGSAKTTGIPQNSGTSAQNSSASNVGAMTLNSIVSNGNGTQSTIPSNAATHQNNTATQPDTSAQNNTPAQSTQALYWAELTVDNRQPYVRQEIVGTLVIYDRIGLEIQSDPRFINASNWEINLLGNPEVVEKNGERVITVRYSMIPLKSGTLTVPGVEIDAIYIDTTKTPVSNSIDGLLKLFELNVIDFRHHFGTQKQARLETKPIAINVQPIPADYGNHFWLPATAVRLTAKWTDKTPVFKIGEAVTREISLTAAGVSEARLPELALPETPAWKQYPEKPQLSSTWYDNQSIAQSVTHVVYIPQKAGSQEIPEIKVRWYNVQTKHIETATIPAEKFYVVGDNLTPPEENIEPDENTQNNISSQQSVATKPVSDTVINRELSQMEQNILIGVAAFAAFLAGLLVSYLLLRRRPQAEKKISEKNYVSQIEDCLKKHDYRGLRDNLLNWGNQVFSDKQINNLSDLSHAVCDDEFTEQMQKLTGILYANLQDTLDKKIILDGVKHNYKKAKDKPCKPLPDLYK